MPLRSRQTPLAVLIGLVTWLGPTMPALALSSVPQEPGDTAQVDTLGPTDVERGQTVTVFGNFPANLKRIEVQLRRLNGVEPDTLVFRPDVTRRADGKALVFHVPWKARLGNYEVLVRPGNNRPVPVSGAAGPLNVVMRKPLTLRSISDSVEYPRDNKYVFSVNGDGFSPIAEDNALVIDGKPDARLCAAHHKPTDNCVVGSVSPDGRTLELKDFPRLGHKGLLKLRVRVGERETEGDAKNLLLSPVGWKLPLFIAVVALLLLVALCYVIAAGKRWISNRPGTVGFFKAALLDQETNTYSLSKLQFYLWTGAAIFGYIYLSAARSLVQGVFELADVPDNLPGIILFSASTSLFAVGISRANGPKGAGDPDPSIADLITTGGVIAPERLQFLIWTILGVLTFIGFTIYTGPGSIETLPSIPGHFLELMGISSAGYLGGKLARKPGPVITDIAAQWGSLIITIYGSHLSPDASFRVTHGDKDEEIPRSWLTNNGQPETVVRDGENFAKVLQLTIQNPPQAWSATEWLSAPHNFTVVNPDGQKAVAKFNVPMTAAQQAEEKKSKEKKTEVEKAEEAKAEKEKAKKEKAKVGKAEVEKAEENPPPPPPVSTVTPPATESDSDEEGPANSDQAP